DWIRRKRLPETLDEPHAGLLPAGFSAEHLGPNDYYYWDDFWGVAGLRSAAALLGEHGDAEGAAAMAAEADRFLAAIDRSVERSVALRSGGRGGIGGDVGIAASPYRRLDSGAIGS